MDGPLVKFGPVDTNNSSQLAIPEFLSRTVTYPVLGLRLELRCVFSGDRVEIAKLTIESSSSYLTTKALTQLALPQVIREIVIQTVPNSQLWRIDVGSLNQQQRSTAYLAQLYWFEHISWGSPRACLMTYMGWSRPYANTKIRRIAEEIPLPGAHSESK
jgi:hypothetical protein